MSVTTDVASTSARFVAIASPGAQDYKAPSHRPRLISTAPSEVHRTRLPRHRTHVASVRCNRVHWKESDGRIRHTLVAVHVWWLAPSSFSTLEELGWEEDEGSGLSPLGDVPMVSCTALLGTWLACRCSLHQGWARQIPPASLAEQDAVVSPCWEGDRTLL